MDINWVAKQKSITFDVVNNFFYFFIFKRVLIG
jgi:hypothetical protein